MSSSCASDMNNRTAQPNATARMPHEKSTKKMPTRGSMRSVPASCAARFPGGIERGRSVDDAVPGQGDSEKPIAKDEILPPMSTEVCKYRTREAHCFYARKELVKLGVNKPGPGRQAQLQIVRYTTSDLNVRMEGVLVEKNNASGVMSHIKMTRHAFVLKVLNCLLQSNDVPFLRDVLFDGAFFASSRSSVPVQNAEACLLKQMVGHIVDKAILWIG